MNKEEFDLKFKELVDMLTSNEKVCDEFVKLPTISDSYRFACSLVGSDLDFGMYEKAIIGFVNGSEVPEVSGGSSKIRNYNELFIDNLIK